MASAASSSLLLCLFPRVPDRSGHPGLNLKLTSRTPDLQQARRTPTENHKLTSQGAMDPNLKPTPQKVLQKKSQIKRQKERQKKCQKRSQKASRKECQRECQRERESGRKNAKKNARIRMANRLHGNMSEEVPDSMSKKAGSNFRDLPGRMSKNLPDRTPEGIRRYAG